MKIVLARLHHIYIRCTVSTDMLIVALFTFDSGSDSTWEFATTVVASVAFKARKFPHFMFQPCSGHAEIVELLLLAGAEAELELSNGASAIHFAVYSGNSNVSWTVTGYELGFYGIV